MVFDRNEKVSLRKVTDRKKKNYDCIVYPACQLSQVYLKAPDVC